MKKRFKKVYIEITNICNLSCSFCQPDHRKKEFMSEERFRKILDQIKGKTQYIYLHVKGEPLLHPKINELIDIASNEGFYINITTNGTCIDQLKNKKVRQINYSLQSTSDIEKARKIIRKLREFQRGTNLYLSLRLWRKEIRKNQEMKKMLEEEFEKHIEQIDGIELDENTFLSIEEEFEWPDKQNKEESQIGYCLGLKDHIAILVDGTVVPCCLDHKAEINLGNIEEQTIGEILKQSRVKEIINGFNDRVLVEQLCQKCSFNRRFTKG